MESNQSSIFRLERASVAFHTPQGLRLVLNDIELDVREGEWVALVGRNGSGKSTLAKVLAGLLPLSRGTMTARDGLRPRLVFQQPEAQIVGETVFEDIAFALENDSVPPSEMLPRAKAALRAVGLEATPARPTKELSGGQKQLLAAACCLAQEAEVLIFDEATSMLDPLGRSRLLEAVRRLHKQGTTVVWVTQLLEETAAADRIVALEDCRITYDGGVTGFYYGADYGTACGGADPAPAASQTPCERIGFTPPYAIQVAKRLLQNGVRLPGLPLTPEHLSEAVAELCRS